MSDYNIDNFESVVDYQTKLENFEGPLDLLLYLVKQAKIRIEDIFVSEVTEQFLKYMDDLDSIDIEKAAEYISMASTLIEIKSNAILPQIEPLEPEEDPKQTLIRNLLDYQFFKEKAQELKSQENVDRFYKEPDNSAFDVRVVYKDFNLEGLIKAFTNLMEKFDLRKSETVNKKEIPKEVFTVRDKIDFIRSTLTERESCSFFDLFTQDATKSEIVTTFQAMLELLKKQYITVEQKGVFDDITILLNPDRSEEIGEIDEYN